MNVSTIDQKLGAFGMVCILCSVSIALIISLAALVTLIYCVLNCVL